VPDAAIGACAERMLARMALRRVVIVDLLTILEWRRAGN
jgi:hypothetical protein